MPDHAMEPDYDVIVVGGGSAGCVMAARLSAHPGRKVLLVEAGPDTPPNREPDDILDSYPGRAYLNPGYGWRDLKAYLAPVPHNAPERPPLASYEQARVMGGGSSINGQVAVRGFPADYDGWAEQGAIGWAWADVLPFFKRLERDFDFEGPGHGRDGPIPIRRIFPDQWDGLTKAAAEAFRQLGFPFRPDMNDTVEEGYSPAPFANAYGRRVSTAMAYLRPQVRARPNLRILDRTQVCRILLDGVTAAGVEVERGGQIQRFGAAHVILSAGALHTPALLMRSGLGPAATLRALGIAVVANLPGVGEGLQDHVAVSISAYLPEHARFSARTGRHIHMHLRYSSRLEACPPLDMVINTACRSAWHPLGMQIGSFQIFVGKPFSRGRVLLRSADWRMEPEIRFELLSDERDCRRLMDGMRRMGQALRLEPLRSTALDPFPSSYSRRVRSLGRLTLSNRALTGIAARIMDGPPALRRWFVRTAIAPGLTLERLLQDEDALEAFVRGNATPTWHACSTCRMGDPADPMGVVDPAGRVRQVQGLWIADASIMPDIPRGNTGLPAIMIGEKMASHFICEARRPERIVAVSGANSAGAAAR